MSKGAKSGRHAGVYAIFGPLGVYVGESVNPMTRSHVVLARRLGWDWTIVSHLPHATRAVRERQERRVMDGYRAAGVQVHSSSRLDERPPAQRRPREYYARIGRLNGRPQMVLCLRTAEHHTNQRAAAQRRPRSIEWNQRVSEAKQLAPRDDKGRFI